MFEPPSSSVQIAVSSSTTLPAELLLPAAPLGWVLFARGNGSARLGPRDRHVARRLHRARIATLLTDLLTAREDEDETRRMDAGLLAGRLRTVTQWLAAQEMAARLPMGYLGGGSGAAAALLAAAGGTVAALVLRGGLTDLAGPDAARQVHAPTLLLVGGHDTQVLEANRQTYQQLAGPRQLHIVQGATHLFEEAGALDEVALEASNWFTQHMK